MVKIEWKERVYNNFVGTMSERDEYQKQEINKGLSVAGIGLWWLNMLVMLIMLLVDTMNHTISIGTILIFLSNMIYANYLTFKLKKKGLNDTECATKEEYLQHKKKLRKAGLKAGVLRGFQMFVFMNYILPYVGSEEISISLFDVVLWSCAGGFFGLTMYIFGLWNLKRLY
ncbi:DUF3278 domain-containing protein [Bacillus wiedmannii]|uniref:DUF3278 domain-containing protein n=1 Tax=Bacillus wiedmannii TaxID=1890302 RepID=UPI000D03A47E|nr:DUF3278 domain-containing protein [Bacillus wiedmannii]PRT33490.1 hypothetical protein C6358_14720 [Bacillus wiedmannii]PRT44961.1 hypothetical protein C6359_14825 [Bacillus wiedmannii]